MVFDVLRATSSTAVAVQLDSTVSPLFRLTVARRTKIMQITCCGQLPGMAQKRADAIIEVACFVTAMSNLSKARPGPWALQMTFYDMCARAHEGRVIHAGRRHTRADV